MIVKKIFKRIQGKAGFIDIQDQNGRIQCYVRLDRIGEEEYSIFSTYDIGDIIGVEGEVFKTKKEEISVKANEVVLLSKSLQVLPEKYHGLKDQDLRYRQREVDIITNPEVKTTFMKRSQIIKDEFSKIPYELKFLAYFMNLKSDDYKKITKFLNESYGGV